MTQTAWIKLKAFKRDDNRDFLFVQNLTLGETDFNRFIRLNNQPVIAAENFGREENMSPVLIPTLSKDMNGHLKPTHRVIDVVYRANRKVLATLLWSNVDKPECFYAQCRLFARKKEDEEYQQVV